MKDKPAFIDVRRIMELLPHRYPFLLVDRIVEVVSKTSVKAYKNVTINEPFFQGHFPGFPVMPGVLILEALAQAGAVIVCDALGDAVAGKLFFYAGMDKVKFRRPVVPGDRLDLHVDEVRNKMHIWKMHGIASVDGEVAAEGEFSAAVVDKERL